MYKLLIVLMAALPLSANGSICSPPYEELSTGCYHVVKDEPANWWRASVKCHKEDASLVMFRNQAEIDSVKELAKKDSTDSDFWFGATSTDLENVWHWSYTGLRINNIPWMDGAPFNRTTDMTCLSMSREHDFKWNNKECNEEKSYMCQKFPSHLLRFSLDTRSQRHRDDCFLPYERVGDKCYHLVDDMASNWWSVLMICESSGGKIAVPKTMEERQYLATVIEEADLDKEVWIGGINLRLDIWEWVHDGSEMTDIPWLENEAKFPKGDEYCLAISNQYVHKWTNIMCDTRLYWACEKEFSPRIAKEEEDDKESKNETQADCLPPFQQNSSGCFLLVEDMLENWWKAAKHCRSIQSVLAAPQTPDEVAAVQALVEKGTKSVFSWLGGNNLGHVLDWKWEHNGKTIEDLPWVSDWPFDSSGDKNCLIIKKNGEGELLNAKCDLPGTFVCQKPRGTKCEIPEEKSLLLLNLWRRTTPTS